MSKEAKARIKINKLLEASGWRFFDDENGRANISLENNVKITEKYINETGEDFEKTKNGYIDFLLLDEKGFPFIVLEAKAEKFNPLIGKEQARNYAKGQGCRLVILSNGNLHYFWDLEEGNPYVISKFPTPESLKGYKTFLPDYQRICEEPVNADYIALTQKPDYQNDPSWKDESLRDAFIQNNKLKFLRKYQLRAVHLLQDAVKEGKNRFLFEMATGTGKTLIASAVIKLFLKTENARRVLFLVDRLELEDQANKAFIRDLKNDFKSVIYKENKEDWRGAEIVVTTVQSLLFDNKYYRIFSPTDFDLVISDEAHRSIGGNARALFEYFVGYKLGLTATPKDYLKKIDRVDDPRDIERRIMLDTYKTFGCESGKPTFRYTLLDGVRDLYLINPVVADARTNVTTQLLSDEGYSIVTVNENNETETEEYFHRDFEKKFFSDDTNRVFCQTFMEKALRDPISNEIGKTIVFTVSQNHAAKITQMLNEMAHKMFPGKYNSDFAMQVTSHISDAKQYTTNFTNNNLGGNCNFLPEYKTSKTRVCVTVGMMTTGYDCPDILNLCLMRPIFSPTDFIQIKGRGTRKHNFTQELFDSELKGLISEPDKNRFKLFDFFANCEYFENDYNYDEILELPKVRGNGPEGPEPPPAPPAYENKDADTLADIKETQIGLNGMKIDRMFFDQFEERMKQDDFIKENIAVGNWERVIEYMNANVLNKPEEFYTLEKLRRAAGVDRKISLREILEKIYGLIPYFKTKDQLLDEEFEKFIIDKKPEDPAHIVAMKYFFKAYASDSTVREIIDQRRYTDLNVNPNFTIKDFKAIPQEWRELIPEYIKDYVSLNKFLH